MIKEFDFESYLFDKYDNEEIKEVIGSKEHVSFLEKKVKDF